MLMTGTGHRIEISCRVQKLRKNYAKHNHEALFVTTYLISNICSWIFPETLVSKNKEESCARHIIVSGVALFPSLLHDCKHNT